MGIKETWKKWETQIHSSEDSKKRILSAQKPDLTPLRLDQEDGFAYFQGSHGRYETFLDYCPCGDFHRRKLPCKHIYRLAMELGLFEGNPVNDISRIKIPRNIKGLDLIPAIDIIEKCSDDAQRIALHLFGALYQTAIPKSEALSELIKSGICYEAENNSLKIGFLNRKEIVKRLKEKGFDVGIIKTSDDELLQLASDNIPDYISEEYSKIAVLSIDDAFSGVKGKLYKYFKRKFEPRIYYDENLSTFASYPNDEITALLISRGFIDLNVVE